MTPLQGIEISSLYSFFILINIAIVVHHVILKSLPAYRSYQCTLFRLVKKDPCMMKVYHRKYLNSRYITS